MNIHDCTGKRNQRNLPVKKKPAKMQCFSWLSAMDQIERKPFNFVDARRIKTNYTIIPRGGLSWTKIFDTKIYSIGLADKSSHARRRFSQDGKVQIENYVISL